jgi:hypothetical protein
MADAVALRAVRPDALGRQPFDQGCLGLGSVQAPQRSEGRWSPCPVLVVSRMPKPIYLWLPMYTEV